ncbi:MAG: 2-phospho-L-lactate guanylyltransferase [Motiliproteus sp.]|jgi:2-phospho-L-lactate guanylyltransferase
MKTLIVIPMKDPRQSKQRLSGVLSAHHRQQLALSLFEQTLIFFRDRFGDYPVLVVTSSERIRAMAGRYGARVLLETPATGLNGAAGLAAQWSCAQGYDAQLLIPADIAVLDEQEIGQLLEQRRESPWVSICPAHDGGTNALMTSPPDAVPFRFGVDSSEVHRAAARQRGVQAVMLKLKNLAFDVDNPVDLQQLAGAPHRILNRIQTQEIVNACAFH